MIIQPNVDCPHGSWEDKCRFIASEIIRILYEKLAITSCNGRFYNTQLIAYHSVDPARMAVVADGIYRTIRSGRN